jgi:hypothetical protein
MRRVRSTSQPGMPKLPVSDTTNAKLSGTPAEFSNASGFRHQREEADPVRNGIFIGLAIVLLVFFGSMIAVLMMHAPSL